MQKNNLTIIKIGGSVLTRKNKIGTPSLRRQTIIRLVREISIYLRSSSCRKEKIILICGAGSFGHPLAKKYHLANLKKREKNKFGVNLTRHSVQQLISFINKILLKENCPAFSLSPASLIQQKGGRIRFFHSDIISSLLKQGLFPLLYGDVVVDEDSEFSICSGDQMANWLSKKFSAKRMFFATDVDGLFTADPKIYPRAKIIKKIKKNQLKNIFLPESKKSNLDVTGLMKGKLTEILKINCPVRIFNGLKKGNLLAALKGRRIGTEITD